MKKMVRLIYQDGHWLFKTDEESNSIAEFETKQEALENAARILREKAAALAENAPELLLAVEKEDGTVESVVPIPVK